jgi:hypothetical protein
MDISEILLRARVDSLYDRIRGMQVTRDIAQGVYEYNPSDILPAFPRDPAAHADALAAWNRIRKQVGSIGPKIVSSLQNAIIGSVSWTGTDNRTDDALRSLKLESFAAERLRDLLVSGITACYAYFSEDGEIRITALTGYIEPFWRADNRDIIEGLYQADSYDTFVNRGMSTRWMVRFYDWSEIPGAVVLRQWRDLINPIAFSGARLEEIENHPPIRYAIADRTGDGYPIGIIEQGAHLLHSLAATEYRLARLEEYAAHPVPVFEEGRVQSVGPGLPVTGDFRWERPGDLSELRERRREKLEAIRDFFGLPVGLLGSQTPSGEALREANLRLFQTASRYASMLSELLTELVNDYLALLGIRQRVEISVLPNRDYIRESVIAEATTLYEKGLMPLEIAALQIQQFFNWPDAEFNAWVKSQSERITPEQLRASIEGVDENGG